MLIQLMQEACVFVLRSLWSNVFSHSAKQLVQLNLHSAGIVPTTFWYNPNNTIVSQAKQWNYCHLSSRQIDHHRICIYNTSAAFNHNGSST